MLGVGGLVGGVVVVVRDDEPLRALAVWAAGVAVATVLLHLGFLGERPKNLYDKLYRLWWAVPAPVALIVIALLEDEGEVTVRAFSVGALLGLALAPYVSRWRAPGLVDDEPR